MAKHNKSLLMNYILGKHSFPGARGSGATSKLRQKHRRETASAMFVLLIFVALIMALTNTNVAAVAMATSSASYTSTESGYYSNFAPTGLLTDPSAAMVVVWVLTLAILMPIEFALRKHKQKC